MSMQNIQELIRQKEALERQINDAQRIARAEAIAKVKELMTEHGLTLVDLGGRSGREAPASKATSGGDQRAGRKVAAKYKNPATGETWTGRGLKPKWLAQALAEGKALDEFLIPTPENPEEDQA